MAEKITIAELNIDTSKVIKANSQLIKQQADLRKSQKELKDSTNGLTEANDEQLAEYANLQAQLKDVNTQINTNNKTVANSIKVSRELDNALNDEIKTKQQAIESNKVLRQAVNGLDATTDENKATIEAYNQRIDENSKFIKENSDEVLQNKQNIGNYKEEVKSALNEVTIFGVSIGSLSQKYDDNKNKLKTLTSGLNLNIISTTKQTLANNTLSTSQKAVAISTQLTTGALKLFRIALISTGVGALVVALGSLISFLSTTQKGIDLVNKALNPLKVSFELLKGAIQNLGSDIFETFSNPKQAINDFIDLLKTNLINRVKGVTETFKALGEIIEGVLSADFSKITKGIEDTAEGVSKTVTGVENLGGKISKFSNSASKNFNEALTIGNKLSQLTIDIENGENNLILLRAKNNKLIREQELISKDVNKTDNERKQAVQTALKLTTQLADEEKRILSLKIQQKEIEFSLNDTSREDQKEINELKAEQIRKDEQSDRTRLRFQGVFNSLSKSNQSQIEEANRLQEKREQDRIKAIEEANKLTIKTLNEELQLFELNEGQKEKTFEQRIEFEKELRSKQLEVINKEEQLGLKSLNEAEIERLKIIQNSSQQIISIRQEELEFNKRESESLFEKSKLELQAFNQSNSLRQDNLRFQEDLLKKEIDLLNQKREIELNNLTLTEQEKENIRESFRQQRFEKEQEFERLRFETEQENRAIELESQLLFLEESGASKEEIQIEQLTRQAEIQIASIQAEYGNTEAGYKRIANTILGYNLQVSKLEQKVNNDRLKARGQVLQGIAQIFGEETAVGKASLLAQLAQEKASAVGQILTSLGVANAKAVAATPLTAGQPFVASNTISLISSIASVGAGVAQAISILNGTDTSGITSGLENIGGGLKKGKESKKTSISFESQPPELQLPAFNTGGTVGNGNIPTQPNGDNVLATLKTGEVVLNQRQQQALGGSSTFASIGVPGFADGGLNGRNTINSSSLTLNNAIDLIQSIPPPQVAVTDIASVSNDVSNVQIQATI